MPRDSAARPRRQPAHAPCDLGGLLGAPQPGVSGRVAGGLRVAQLQQQLPPAREHQPAHPAAEGAEAQRARLGVLPAAGREGLELRRELLRHLRGTNARGQGQGHRLQSAAQRDPGASRVPGRRVQAALPRDARVPRGVAGGDPKARWPGHLLGKPGPLHWPGSGQRDADLPPALPARRPLATRDVPRAPQSRRSGGPHQLGTRDAQGLGLEPRVHSLGLHLHCCPRRDPARLGSHLPVQIPGNGGPGQLSRRKKNNLE
ncbi:intercellular adhesion molecule 4 isoform X2 [Tamandua tetradactyla]|uniref:intercellular adhesion molecule 4 isoform X2 n=1 Tax=Tamandua tetradactyla TaxID=48850 RepID=UPI004053F04A